MTQSICKSEDWLDVREIVPKLHTWVWVKKTCGTISQHWWDDMEDDVLAWMPLGWSNL